MSTLKLVNFLRLGFMVTAALLAASAYACRPFGSYTFVEDAEGGIWFTEGDNNAVSRLAPDGEVKAFPLPTRNAEPMSLALDRNGNLWFVEGNAAKIGRLDRNGKIVEFPSAGGHTLHVAVDARGDAWFAQMAGGHSASPGEHAGHGAPQVSKIGRITKNGGMVDYPISEGWPTKITVDSQDRIWVSLLVPAQDLKDNQAAKGKIALLDRNGNWRFVLERQGSCPMNLTAGLNGEVWFSDKCQGTIERIDSNGRRAVFKQHPDTFVRSITLAQNGDIWFADDAHLKFGRIDRKGEINLIDLPANGDAPFTILATRGGDIVFSEAYNYNINRLTSQGVFEEHLINTDERLRAREVRKGEVCYIKFGTRIASKSELDQQRAEEVRLGKLKPAADGAEQLAEEKCLKCHDSRRILLSRRNDWSPSIGRMQEYMRVRNTPLLTDGEKQILLRYFNTEYGLAR